MGEHAEDILDGLVDPLTGEARVPGERRNRIIKKKKPVGRYSKNLIESEEEVIQLFSQHISKRHEKYPELYTLNVVKTNNGWLVLEYYDRNSWCDSELSRKILFSGGRIFENHKKIGSY